MNINLNGINIHYRQSGRGAPLILLHGNSEDLGIFDKLAHRLKDHFTVYAIDSRNHGKSSVTDDFGYDAMARDVTCFVEALELRDVSVVGFSDGAIIALRMAMDNPSVFRRMALLGANLSPDDFKPEVLEYLKAEYERTGDPLVKLMLDEPHIEPEELCMIHIPALVIAAEDDIYKADTFERITSSLPDARFLLVEGHDHGSYICGNDMLYPDLIAFFQE